MDVYYTPPEKKMKLNDSEHSEKGTILVDLNKLTVEKKGNDEVKKYDKKRIQLKSGSTQPNSQSFFPLAVDDYFMTVAMLSRELSDKVWRIVTKLSLSVWCGH